MIGKCLKMVARLPDVGERVDGADEVARVFIRHW